MTITKAVMEQLIYCAEAAADWLAEAPEDSMPNELGQDLQMALRKLRIELGKDYPTKYTRQ